MSLSLSKKLLTTPPPILWQKIRRRLKRQVRQTWARLETRLGRAGVSDREFFRAITRPDFLADGRARRQARFFIDPADRTGVISTLRTVCPAIEPATIAAADRVCDHIFDLLGSGPVYLGHPIDWHTDFKTGHRWEPTAFYLDLAPAPYPGGYDIKVPWELSRCQHFAWLGQAYWFTSDEKYAREFAAQVADWIAHNPPRQGVNWVCTMDVAIRAVNWLWGYAFFQDSPSLSDDFRLDFLKSLLIHGRHIVANLEYSETLTSNHYLSNIVGLVYLGILLPEFKEAEKWRSFGLQELEKEMLKQVYPDGVDFEASTAYHRLVTEMFLSATLLARLNGHTFSPAYMARLERMLEFILHLTKPDGTVPLFGDNDNGRLHRLKVWDDPPREWRDFRYLLAVAAPLFNRPDFARAAGDQWAEAVWFWGTTVHDWRVQADAAPPELPHSAVFPQAGIYILRHNDFYLAVDAGPNGQNDNGGHAHNDVLSFELSAFGRDWIVDPGTYVYTADYAARNRFRATAAHNTVMVDGQEQNRFDERLLFRMQADARPRVQAWQSTPAYDLLVAEHYGYTRLPEPVTHRRAFYLDKTESFCWIRDELAGTGQHRVEWFFHFHQGVQYQLDTQGVLLKQEQHCMWLISLECIDAKKLPPIVNIDKQSNSYGQVCPGIMLHYYDTMNNSLTRNWLLYHKPDDTHLLLPDCLKRWTQRVAPLFRQFFS
ncbi:hypothetical protein D6779_08585 [Candidatus Parcubacteria bacterium]|nr:MAG: hypothetical protein D6779_08585 [Candidatus Parcubacteria bacterium]